MTEENTTPAAETVAPKKKAAAKRAPSKAKASTVKKTAAAKPSASKAAKAQPEAQTSKQTSTQAEASQSSADTSEHSDTAAQASASNQSHDYDAKKMVEDLKGRDWPKIIQRALLMVFFGFLAWITISVAFFLATAQVVISIFVGEPNKALTQLIKQGANYIHDVLDYLSFASDECPFPFGRSLPEAD